MKAVNFYVSWAHSTCLGLLQLKEYSKAWDETLNRLIDEHWKTAVHDGYAVSLGGAEVWISNRFYAYGYALRGDVPGRLRNRRPSLKTMYRLARLVAHIDRESRHV